MVILIDFDGTCVSHAFPQLGDDIGAVPVLKDLVSNGHKLILFTMRDNKGCKFNPQEPGIIGAEGEFLNQAVKWFSDNDIPLFGVQKNPTQHIWTTSPKAYGNLIIDDTSLGIPLKSNGGREFVDWEKARVMLENIGYL